ncbi:hypothetical protein B0H12DRAFT_1245026 [Mycena haematopus]|nr:hypothetical protein B0H12DRAFT_1245026 [Mycena haematopus]
MRGCIATGVFLPITTKSPPRPVRDGLLHGIITTIQTRTITPSARQRHRTFTTSSSAVDPPTSLALLDLNPSSAADLTRVSPWVRHLTFVSSSTLLVLVETFHLCCMRSKRSRFQKVMSGRDVKLLPACFLHCQAVRARRISKRGPPWSHILVNVDNSAVKAFIIARRALPVWSFADDAQWRRFLTCPSNLRTPAPSPQTLARLPLALHAKPEFLCQPPVVMLVATSFSVDRLVTDRARF